MMDESGRIIQHISKTSANLDLSNADWIKLTKKTLLPSFSNGFIDKEDVKLTLALTYPIVNKDTRTYMGLISALISVSQFFQKYENVNNITSQYFAVLDNKSVQLIHPLKSLVGKPFFGNYTQRITGHIPTLNNFIKQVMSGKPGYVIYDFVNGERLNTGYPIFVLGKPVYYVFIVTPTATIYSPVDNILLNERIESYSLLAGITAAVVSLIVVLVKWNGVLDCQVKKRTKELSLSNKKFELTAQKLKKTNESLDEKNKQLEIQDNMQKEFINVAAHELRTPIQSIMGFSEMLENECNYNNDYVTSIIRNTATLRMLASNIRDITRIESHSLKLDKQRFNLDELLVLIIKDYQIQLEKDKKTKDLQITYRNLNQDKKDVVVYADKARITQVISNLIENTIKFSRQGEIIITVGKQNNTDDNVNPISDKDKVIVSMRYR